MEEERYPSLPWQGWKIVKKLGRGGWLRYCQRKKQI